MKKLLFIICLLSSICCYGQNQEISFQIVDSAVVVVDSTMTSIKVQDSVHVEDLFLYGQTTKGLFQHGGNNVAYLKSNFEKANSGLNGSIVNLKKGLVIELNKKSWANSVDTIRVFFPLEIKDSIGRGTKKPDFSKVFLLKLIKEKKIITDKSGNFVVPLDSTGAEAAATTNELNNNSCSLESAMEFLNKYVPHLLLFFILLVIFVFFRQNKIAKQLNSLTKVDDFDIKTFDRRLQDIEKYLKKIQRQKPSPSSDNSSISAGLVEIKNDVANLKSVVDQLVKRETVVGRNTVLVRDGIKLDETVVSHNKETEKIFDTTDVEYSEGNLLIIKENPNYRLFKIYSKNESFFFTFADEGNPEFCHQMLDVLNVINDAVDVVNSLASPQGVRVSQPGELAKQDDMTFRIVKKMQVELV